VHLLPSLTASRQSIRAELIYIKAHAVNPPFGFCPWRIASAASYSLHWSGVAYTRAEPVRWLGLTAVKGRSPRIR
jgi:hypothetical protein